MKLCEKDTYKCKGKDVFLSVELVRNAISEYGINVFSVPEIEELYNRACCACKVRYECYEEIYLIG